MPILPSFATNDRATISCSRISFSSTANTARSAVRAVPAKAIVTSFPPSNENSNSGVAPANPRPSSIEVYRQQRLGQSGHGSRQVLAPFLEFAPARPPLARSFPKTPRRIAFAYFQNTAAKRPASSSSHSQEKDLLPPKAANAPARSTTCHDAGIFHGSASPNPKSLR